MDAASAPPLVPQDTAETTQPATGALERNQSLSQSLMLMRSRLDEIGKSSSVRPSDKKYLHGVARKQRPSAAQASTAQAATGGVAAESEAQREQRLLREKQRHFAEQAAAVRKALEEKEKEKQLSKSSGGTSAPVTPKAGGKAPMSEPGAIMDFSPKALSERHATFRRDFRSRLYETRVHLRNHPEHDLYFKESQRLAAFPKEVDAVVEMLQQRGISYPLCSTKKHGRRRTLAGGGGGTGSTGSADDDERDLSTVSSLGSMRRLRREQGGGAATGHQQRFASVIALEAAEPYAGPIVPDRVRSQIEAKLASRRNAATGGAGSPSPIRGARGIDNTVSSIDLTALGLDMTAGSLNHTAGSAGSRQNRGRGAVPLTADDGSVVAAAAGSDSRTQSKLLETLIVEKERSAKAARASSPSANRTLSCWFPEEQHARNLSRPTASTLTKRAQSCMTFFDENGLIDGRDADVLESIVKIRPGDAHVPRDLPVVTRNKVMRDEREQVRKWREARHPELVEKQRSAARHAMSYSGPHHIGGHEARGDVAPPPPTEARMQRLLDVVFVRGGDVGSYLRRMQLEASQGLLRHDVRRSAADRLGGSSKSRGTLGVGSGAAGR